LIQLQFADADARGTDASRRRSSGSKKFIVIQGAFPLVFSLTGAVEDEYGESPDATDPSIEFQRSATPRAETHMITV
jgi:hypothetical protein